MTVFEFVGVFVPPAFWGIISTVRWRRERRRRRVLYSEYRVLQDAALTISRANQDLEQERKDADDKTV